MMLLIYGLLDVALGVLAALVVVCAACFAAGCIHMIAKNQGRPL